MVTKEGKTDFKDKQNTFINENNHDNQYSNLNLNGNYKCSSTSSVQSHSKTTTSGKNCGSNYVSTYMKPVNGLEQVQEMFEIRKANYQNDIPEKYLLNNSTLSLHIAAYENSAEASALTNECNEEKEGSNNGKSGLYKKAKQIIAGSVSTLQ
uniref:Uncharacterized protein n=1 Tax=Panagrolaimus sp. ES5 TaxID=591445 RepID=A0AC34F6M5_9BILA